MRPVRAAPQGLRRYRLLKAATGLRLIQAYSLELATRPVRPRKFAATSPPQLASTNPATNASIQELVEVEPSTPPTVAHLINRRCCEDRGSRLLVP
jgi:hypothetical protein